TSAWSTRRGLRRMAKEKAKAKARVKARASMRRETRSAGRRNWAKSWSACQEQLTMSKTSLQRQRRRSPSRRACMTWMTFVLNQREWASPHCQHGTICRRRSARRLDVGVSSSCMNICERSLRARTARSVWFGLMRSRRQASSTIFALRTQQTEMWRPMLRSRRLVPRISSSS
ncbi:Ano10, partial [Symbiodinium pilosum]